MTNEKIIWDYLSQYFNPYAVAGIMGNLYAESALNPQNLQGSYEKKLSSTDLRYTKAVDNNTYKNFVKDQAGYGLAQWTYWTRKQKLLKYAKSTNRSIGDIYMQLEFLVKELKENYTVSCYNPLLRAKSVSEASNIILLNFEKPKDQSSSVQKKRASYGQRYYDQFVEIKLGDRTLKKGINGKDVKELQSILINLGYNVGIVDGKFGEKTFAAVQAFQQDNELIVDGIVGVKTFEAIKKLQK